MYKAKYFPTQHRYYIENVDSKKNPVGVNLPLIGEETKKFLDELLLCANKNSTDETIPAEEKKNGL